MNSLINTIQVSNRYPFSSLDVVNEMILPRANKAILNGHIPDLRFVLADLFESLNIANPPYSALQFLLVLQSVQDKIHPGMLHKFLSNPERNHVLIENELMKVVLIRWEKGFIGNIHGHPKGGCVFKVLRGSLEEMRYTKEESPKLLSVSVYQKDAMTYIDDRIGLHAVGNPFDEPAISLHVYTPGQ
ncbi:cysteine dioxygenase family protein [Marinoscillum sp. MHG1-6]|uniref:cysteine dioxygenase n=1 Tax=Marinoscillum sp. MHG1-6 TaxID=2959627 RepID=UPI0021579CF5|nr:cysteine dioxygenase family protein [Marinoscillum sp. MHG1-6]